MVVQEPQPQPEVDLLLLPLTQPNSPADGAKALLVTFVQLTDEPIQARTGKSLHLQNFKPAVTKKEEEKKPQSTRGETCRVLLCHRYLKGNYRSTKTICLCKTKPMTQELEMFSRTNSFQILSYNLCTAM